MLAERAAARAAWRLLDPAPVLDPDLPDPDLEVLPPAMREMLDSILTVGEHLLTLTVGEHVLTPAVDESSGPLLHGVGIGHEVFEGTARLALSADEALEALEDGEILVTNATSSAFNLVLTIAGGLAAEGGGMAHAAILARELGLPAVVGAIGCLDAISNGDRLRVDPIEETVTILD